MSTEKEIHILMRPFVRAVMLLVVICIRIITKNLKAQTNARIKMRISFSVLIHRPTYITCVYRENVQCLRIFVMYLRTTTVVYFYLKTSVFISYNSKCSNWSSSWVIFLFDFFPFNFILYAVECLYF
jgi:hypothetical protein